MSFTRQPQTLVPIDQSNPITVGLLVCTNPASYVDSLFRGMFTQSGAPTKSTGNAGVGLMTDGSASDSWIAIPSIALTKFTLFGIFRSNSSAVDTRALALGSSIDATPIIQIGSSATTASKVRSFARDNFSGGPNGTDSTASAFDGTQHSVAVTYDGATFSVYIDGKLDVTTAAAGSTFTVDRFSVGSLRRASSAVFWAGTTFFGAAWKRSLSAAEIWSMNVNANQVFLSPVRRISQGFTSASGSTGTVAYTNANDSLAGAGTTSIVGSLAKTNANDTLAASGAVGVNITGTVNVTNANDTLVAAGTTTITGVLAKANANDSLVGSGTTSIIGTVSKTNANDTLAASGIADSITGTVAYTNNNDTSAAVGIGSPNIQTSGGFFEVPHIKRRATIQEDRERLGIIPKKIKRVIEAVAQQSVSQEKTDIQAQLLLTQKLAKQDIEAKAKYAEFMRQERDRILSRDIKLALLIRAKQQADDEDDEYAVEMLLL